MAGSRKNSKRSDRLLLIKKLIKDGKVILKILVGIIIGASLGGVIGYYGKCSSGACPLTSTPLRGAIYGAFLGTLFSLSLFK